MSPTAPFKVLLLIVFTTALLASQHPRVKPASTLDQLLDTDLRLLLVHGKLLNCLLQSEKLVKLITVFFV